MCTRIVDIDNVASVNFGKHSVYGEFIAVFAKRTCYIIFFIALLVFFAEHGNMVICSVDSRSHKVYCTSVNADIFLMCMLFIDGSSDKCTVRTHHKSAEFRTKFNISHSCRNKNFIKYFVHALSDYFNIIRLLIGSVRNTYTAGEVNKGDICACLFL